MKRKAFLLTGLMITMLSFVRAQNIPQFNPANDPVAWGNPNAAVPGNIYVSRYGYWRNQPVKMAYWTSLPHYQIPPVFHLSDERGRVVYTGQPVWMRDPTNVMVPIGFFYPGIRMYALNFSGFNNPGTYYIEMPGYRNSSDFNIRGYIPGDMMHIPGPLTFEREAGMLPPRSYLNPVLRSYPLPY